MAATNIYRRTNMSTTLCLKKTCHTLVTITSENLNRFSKLFTAEKPVEFPTMILFGAQNSNTFSYSLDINISLSLFSFTCLISQ